MNIPLSLIIDSEELFTSLSTMRSSIDYSIQADMNFINCEFEQNNDARITWVPANLNLTHPGTKSDIPLTTSSEHTMFYGHLDHSFDGSESCDADLQLMKLPYC